MCIFCQIAQGEIPANIVWESENLIAFHDIHPKAPVHILVVPKKHIPTWMDLTEEDRPLIADLHFAIQAIAKKLNIADRGFRVVNNCKEDGGQEVFHLHYHLLGGTKLTL